MKYLILIILMIGAFMSCTKKPNETYKLEPFSNDTIFINNGEINSRMSLSSNPYLDDDAKDHIVNNLKLSVDTCTGEYKIIIITQLPIGSIELWSFDLLIGEQQNDCITYNTHY